MVAKKNDLRPQSVAEHEKSDSLLLYRLSQVEGKVDDISHKLDNQDTIKKADLVELRSAIIERFNEKNELFEKALDKLDNDKADKSELQDFKKVVWSVFGLLGSVVTAFVIYSITTGANNA